MVDADGSMKINITILFCLVFRGKNSRFVGWACIEIFVFILIYRIVTEPIHVPILIYTTNQSMQLQLFSLVLLYTLFDRHMQPYCSLSTFQLN